jgi:NADH-quinone oxidoreductase subunit C
MQDKDILLKIKQKFGETDFRWVDDHSGDPYLVIPVERLRQLAAFLKEEPALGFDSLMSISGVHQTAEIEKIEVVYHLFSYRHRHRLVFKVQLERPLALFHYYLRVDTVSDIWPAASWLEREIYDMLGVHFRGHRDFRRLLLPSDWQGYPLLKDYLESGAYRGITTTREETSLADPEGEKQPIAGTS